MSVSASLKKMKGLSVMLRLLAVAALVLAMVGAVIVPATAQTALITQIRFPTPPGAVLNLGTDTEFFWWKAEYETTPLQIKHEINGPPGSVNPVHSDFWLAGSAGLPGSGSPGAGSPAYNPEDSTGAHQGDTSTIGPPAWQTFAHPWQVPAGAIPGTYHSIVSFYSAEVGGFETSSDVTFFVRQPLKIFKYHDLNGNGAFNGTVDPPTGEPGLDGWHFDVVGPAGAFGMAKVSPAPAPTTTTFTGLGITIGFPTAGEHLVVNGVDRGAYTLSGDVFTLAVAMGAPPVSLQDISVNIFHGDTSGGGNLVLPDLLAGGVYTFTETMEPGWQNTDPPGAAPIQKTINVPSGINQLDPTVYFGNKQVTPDSDVGITSSSYFLPPGGGTVTLIITEANTGAVDLFSVNVTLFRNGVQFGPVLGYPVNPPSSGDDGDQVLEDGVTPETWSWTIAGVPITETTSFTVRGDGLYGDPPAQWSWRNDTSEEESITIVVEPPRRVPASGNLGTGIMIAALVGIMSLFIYRRTRRSNQLS